MNHAQVLVLHPQDPLLLRVPKNAIPAAFQGKQSVPGADQIASRMLQVIWLQRLEHGSDEVALELRQRIIHHLLIHMSHFVVLCADFELLAEILPLVKCFGRYVGLLADHPEETAHGHNAADSVAVRFAGFDQALPSLEGSRHAVVLPLLEEPFLPCPLLHLLTVCLDPAGKHPGDEVGSRLMAQMLSEYD